MSAFQSNVDELIKEHFAKQQEALAQKNREDQEPQPFSQFTLVQYFLDEFNNSHDADMPEEERQQHALRIACEVKRLLAMTRGEIKEYFAEVDRRRIEATEKANDRTIFEFCLIREISQLKCSGAERESLRTSRIEAYEAGEFDYSIDAKRSEEILIRMEDLHFPDSNKKLKEVDQSSTYEKLLKMQQSKKLSK